MIIELAGNRILSVWFGNGLFTLTGLIGTLLIFMGAGSYLGGYLVDKYPKPILLSLMLMISGVFSMLVPYLRKMGDMIPPDINIIAGPVLATLLLFSVPGLLLGTITPIAIRLTSLQEGDHHIGLSAGTIGAWGIIGSVFGTFVTGFYLIPTFSLPTLYCWTGIILILLGLATYFILNKFSKNLNLKTLGTMSGLSLLVIIVISMNRPGDETTPYLVHEESSFYHRIRIFEYPTSDGDIVRQLSLDTTSEGSQYLYKEELPFAYQQFWKLSQLYMPQNENTFAAFLGGGAFGMPLAVGKHFPSSIVDVIEIDPKVVEVGRKYFKAFTNPRVKIHTYDARLYLRNNLAKLKKNEEGAKKYHLIFGDTYNGIRAIPSHFVTQEYFKLISESLNENGVYMVNIISALEGSKSEFFQSFYKTLKSVFPFVEIYAVQDPTNFFMIQNIVLVSGKNENPIRQNLDQYSDVNSLLENKIEIEQLGQNTKGQIYTDDFNPVEYVITKSLLN